MDQSATRPHPGPLILRLAFYGGLQLGAMYLHLVITTGGDVASAHRYMAEGSWLEWIQIALLAGSILIVLFGPGPRGLIRPLLLCVLIAAVARELDVYFAEYLWKRAHRVVMIAMICLALGILWRRREEALPAIGGFLTRPGFWLMYAGVGLAVIYGVILGQNVMWLEASASGFDRVNKRFVEEGLEASGYLWIFFGVVEEVLLRPRTDRTTAA